MFRRYPGEIAAVVLDLSMSHMNGEEALPELRRIRPEVSGYSESETMALFQVALASPPSTPASWISSRRY